MAELRRRGHGAAKSVAAALVGVATAVARRRFCADSTFVPTTSITDFSGIASSVSRACRGQPSQPSRAALVGSAIVSGTFATGVAALATQIRRRPKCGGHWSMQNCRRVGRCVVAENSGNPVGNADNIALVFVKPHARTPAMLEFVPAFLKERGVEVIRSGTVGGDEIEKKSIIDSHYAAIARVGMTRDVASLGLGQAEKEKFSSGYGVEFDNCLQAGVVHSAITALEVLDVTPGELLQRCLDMGYVKMGSGLYCAKLQGKQGSSIYVLNGFYARMREKFVARGVVVNWFVVRFDGSKLSWRRFRGDVIGATNPPDAIDGSLRARVLRQWQELGLPEEPNYQDNGVHASAGPLEALRERAIWLGDDPTVDEFGIALMEQGKSTEDLTALLENPRVIPSTGGEPTPIFDMLEDMDAADALKAITSCSVVA